MPKHYDFGATEENTIKNGTAYGANRLEVIFMTDDEKKLIQAKHRLEQAENRNRKRERTERNHRLIVEGAILETPPDLDRRVDSPALSGRGSRPSGRTSG